MHLAVETGSLELCKLFNEFHCNWEDEDFEGMSPLFYSIKVKSLLKIY